MVAGRSITEEGEGEGGGGGGGGGGSHSGNTHGIIEKNFKTI